MCTVTVIATGGGGFRLVTNRDESRRRAPALAPRRHVLSTGQEALWPVDPVGAGTWIGVAGHGLVLTILNLNLPGCAGAQPGAPSRGGLLPGLLEQADPSSVGDALARIDLDAYTPFRMLALDGTRMETMRWDGKQLSREDRPLGACCLASSGLGDHLVEARLGLFDEFLEEHGETPAMQDLFHEHVWEGREEISVLMSRPDARTVSTTAVAVRARSITMDYRDDDGAHPTLTMERIAQGEWASC